MCYARRQRSSWARIKLSKKLYIKQLLRFRLVCTSADVIPWSPTELRITQAAPRLCFSLLDILFFRAIWSCSYFNLPFVRVSKELSRFVCLSFCLIVFRSQLHFVLFLHLLLFNFQGPSLAAWLRLWYYIISFSLCQGVFEKFFKNFFSFPPSSGLPHVISHTRPWYYITSRTVCQPLFQTFFRKSFSRSLPFAVGCSSQLVYYTTLFRICQADLADFLKMGIFPKGLFFVFAVCLQSVRSCPVLAAAGELSLPSCRYFLSSLYIS